VAAGPTSGEDANPRVGPTSFPRAAFLSLYVLGFRSGGAAWLMRGGPRFARMLRRSWNRHASQFLVGHYCSVEITGPELSMITTPEPTGLRAYGMRGDSILVPPLHLLVVQRQLMSGAWTHSSAPGYAEHTVWARSVAPDGLPLTWEDK
jgi:hypothetical protein